VQEATFPGILQPPTQALEVPHPAEEQPGKYPPYLWLEAHHHPQGAAASLAWPEAPLMPPPWILLLLSPILSLVSIYHCPALNTLYTPSCTCVLAYAIRSLLPNLSSSLSLLVNFYSSFKTLTRGCLLKEAFADPLRQTLPLTPSP
jgi:hypothetical protein